MSTPRIGPKAPRVAHITIDGLAYACCRGCGQPLKRKDGSPALKRTWCDAGCVDEYVAQRSSRGLRRVTFKRDHGRCAACGRECCVRVDRCEAMVKVAGRWYVRHGYWRLGDLYWREVFAWEADHIIPLEDGGSREMTNVQSLCEPHHVEKTTEENRRRAWRRRQQAAMDSGQTALDL